MGNPVDKSNKYVCYTRTCEEWPMNFDKLSFSIFKMCALVFLWKHPYWFSRSITKSIIWVGFVLFFVCLLVILMIIYKSNKAGHVSHLELCYPKQEQTVGNSKMIHEATEARRGKKKLKPDSYLRHKTVEVIGSM